MEKIKRHWRVVLAVIGAVMCCVFIVVLVSTRSKTPTLEDLYDYISVTNATDSTFTTVKETTTASTTKTTTETTTEATTVSSGYLTTKEMKQQLVNLLSVHNKESFEDVISLGVTDNFRSKFYSYIQLKQVGDSSAPIVVVDKVGIEYKDSSAYSYLGTASIKGSFSSKSVFVVVDIRNGCIDDIDIMDMRQ